MVCYLNSKEVRDAFLRKVTKTDSCWLWVGSKLPSGYGQFVSLSLGTKYAHRASYLLFVGPIETGKEIDHLCQNRSCVNPDHLEVVDHRTNILRGNTLFAEEARKTHCLRGHEFDQANTAVYRGQRRCRACGREWKRNRRKAERGHELLQ